MTDILERLADLHAQMRISQRTGDGSVACIARDAAKEIKALRLQAAALEGLNADLFRTRSEGTRLNSSHPRLSRMPSSA